MSTTKLATQLQAIAYSGITNAEKVKQTVDKKAHNDMHTPTSHLIGTLLHSRQEGSQFRQALESLMHRHYTLLAEVEQYAKHKEKETV